MRTISAVVYYYQDFAHKNEACWDFASQSFRYFDNSVSGTVLSTLGTSNFGWFWRVLGFRKFPCRETLRETIQEV